MERTGAQILVDQLLVQGVERVDSLQRLRAMRRFGGSPPPLHPRREDELIVHGANGDK